MLNLDELLQERLVALENGVPLETVLAALPPEASQLAPLIKLAATAHSIPQPRLDAAAVQAQKIKVVAAARASIQKPGPFVWLTFHKEFVALGAGLAIFIFVAMAVLGTALFLAGPASAHSAQLSGVNGLVEVASSATSNDWHFITANQRLSQGQVVHTYADSSAILTFFDGSRTAIGPDSELVLTHLSGGWGSVLQVQLDQTVGETTHNVVPLRGSSGFFLVNTPAGQASVHGTSFDVNVSTTGEALFSVTRGKVQVKNASSQVLIASGQSTTVMPGKDPAKPANQFTLIGTVETVTDTEWMVSGVTLVIIPETDILGTYQAGDPVLVKGRILASGEWDVDSIEPPDGNEHVSHFTGVIETMNGVPGAWQISGHTINVDHDTELGTNLKIGSNVRVAFVILPDHGGWLAKEIDNLDEDEEPTATPTTTSTLTVTPTVTGTADTSTPTETLTLTPTVTGTPDTATPTATVTGTPDTSTPTPTMTGTPGTATPTQTETITSTPTVTSTLGTATPTTTITATPTVPPKNDTSRCDNRTQQQPEALRLAQRYNVPYTDIMNWFCKGFGFGEIDLAYSLSLSSGMPVSDIFALRSSGLGWGQIKKQVSPQAQATPGSKNNGNGHNK